MAITINKKTYSPYEQRMQKTVDHLQENLNTIRAGRANPRVLDQISVSYYGVDTPLNQVANINVPEPRLLQIQPWDKSLLETIVKAIQASDLGINPQNDGQVIRLTFPPLTEERRRELVKQTREYGEEAKIAIRNIRRDFLDTAKDWEKQKEISEDSLRHAEEEIQKRTDDYIEKVDQALENKEKDLMEF